MTGTCIRCGNTDAVPGRLGHRCPSRIADIVEGGI